MNALSKTLIARTVIASAVAGAFVVPAAAKEIKLTAISGHPPVVGSVKHLKGYFIPEIDKRLKARGSKYTIKWTQAYAGSVAKPPAVFEAIEEGLGDIGHVGMLFEAAKAPLETISYVTPFGSAKLGEVLDVVDAVEKQVPEMTAAYKRFGQKLLIRVGVDDYHVLTTSPVTKIADLKGRKLGAGGIAASWIKGTGAVPVRGNLTTYYNAVKTGVYDGMVVFGSSIPGFKYFEVTKHLTTVSFGAMFSSSITMNLDRWNDLPKDVQEVFNEVLPSYRAKAVGHYVAGGERAIKVARDNGVTIHDMAAEERRKWALSLPNIAKAWAKRLDDKKLPGTKVLNTYMELSRKAGIKFARDWDKE
tara:strand:+ start:3961 stop:5040 length:1080 start_codon:yes stop_codon:yes gene_type:complete